MFYVANANKRITSRPNNKCTCKVRFSLNSSCQHQLQTSRIPATYYKNPNMVRPDTYEAHSQTFLLYLSVDKNHYMKWLTVTLDYLELLGR
jgi:hypothetical protein